MDKQLLAQALLKFTLGLLLTGLLLFVPAGTLNYPKAWLLLAVLFVPMFLAGIIMLFKRPDLLRRRLNLRETEPRQKRVVALSGVMFLCGFTVAGLDHRFGWLPMPGWVSTAGAVLFMLAYLLYAQVLRENTYLSRTVEVQPNQKVIDTGLYSVVRHPMYTATLVLFLSMPLILGSVLAVPIFLFYIPIIASRIQNEEQVLERQLSGYSDYKKRVKYRLIPLIW